MKKILYITNYDVMYGANKALFELMCGVNESGHVEPYLLVPGGGDIGKLCEEKGITVLPYDFRISTVDDRISNKEFRKLTRRIMRYKEFVSIRNKLKDIKFDMIHSNSSIFDIGLYLADQWKIPHIWHVREFAKEDYHLESIFSNSEIAKKYNRSSAIIAISHAINERIQSYDNKLDVDFIYDGVEICDEYEKTYFNDDKINFCIIGTMIESKGQMDVLKAALLLEPEVLEKIKIFFVGGTGSEYYNSMQEFINANPSLRDCTEFTGYCNDVATLLKRMDVGIMASKKEAFGRVTVEYMSNYMPVIGTNSGGTPELIAEEQDLFEPGNIRQLADKMLLYINNKERLMAVGKKSRTKAVEFSVDANVNRILELYNKVSGKVIK